MNDDLSVYNNLIGNLKGNVQFAQSHIIPSKTSAATGQYWAHLVSLRDTLVLFKPLDITNIDSTADVFLQVLDENGNIIQWSKENKKMMTPNELPRPAESISLANSDIKDCTGEYGKIVKGRSDLKKLEGDKEGNKISSLLGNVAKGNGLKIETANGAWIRDFHLPKKNPQLDGKFITFTSKAGLYSNIRYEDGINKLVQGDTKCFINRNGRWIESSDLKSEYNRIIYGNNFWSLKLPSDVIKPGISMKLTFGEKSGTLGNIKVGAPNVLLVNTIDIGLLTPHRNKFEFQQDPKYHSQYFQQIPASRLIVNQYEPITLEKVVLRDGTSYTSDKGSSKRGTWHVGDLRDVGRKLITTAMANANYGVHSTSSDDYYGPFACSQMNANNMIGKYSDGNGGTVLQVHGGSGGGGIADLDSSIGNELSHEFAHSFGAPFRDRSAGLPDYNALDPTGLFATQALHRPANKPGSTWGWDSIKNVFIPNFQKLESEKEICIEYSKEGEAGTNKAVKDKKCQAPFQKLFTFGKDAMGGGEPFYPSTNSFTLHTPFTSYMIQGFFEYKAVFDDSSKTGMRKWHPECSCMAEWKSDLDKVEDDASKDYPRQPKLQGIAVTTVLGFYDPQGIMESHIYPALHGAYGNSFEESSTAEIEMSRCIANVMNHKEKTKKYVLKGERPRNYWGYDPKKPYMNKFHINVEQSFQPKIITIQCRNSVKEQWKDIASGEITQPQNKVFYTINGNGMYWFSSNS